MGNQQSLCCEEVDQKQRTKNQAQGRFDQKQSLRRKQESTNSIISDSVENQNESFRNDGVPINNPDNFIHHSKTSMKKDPNQLQIFNRLENLQERINILQNQNRQLRNNLNIHQVYDQTIQKPLSILQSHIIQRTKNPNILSISTHKGDQLKSFNNSIVNIQIKKQSKRRQDSQNGNNPEAESFYEGTKIQKLKLEEGLNLSLRKAISNPY